MGTLPAISRGSVYGEPANLPQTCKSRMWCRTRATCTLNFFDELRRCGPARANCVRADRWNDLGKYLAILAHIVPLRSDSSNEWAENLLAGHSGGFSAAYTLVRRITDHHDLIPRLVQQRPFRDQRGSAPPGSRPATFCPCPRTNSCSFALLPGQPRNLRNERQRCRITL